LTDTFGQCFATLPSLSISRIEVHDDALATEIGELDLLAVGRRQRERRRLLAYCDHRGG
jgi:hypothetical protein